MRGERELPALPDQRLAEPSLELRPKRITVEACRVLCLVLVERLALHDLTLAGEERRELMLCRLQRGHFGFDAEQLRQKILELRRERDQQLRFFLARERIGTGARAGKARGERSIGLREPGAEDRVQPPQAGRGIEVAKAQPETELEHREGCHPYCE